MLISKSRLKIHAALTVFAVCCIMTVNSFASAGAVQSYTSKTDGVLFTMATGSLKLKVCTPSIIRVMYSPTSSFSTRASIMVYDSFPNSASWSIDTSSTAVTIKTSKMQAVVTKSTGAIQFLDASGNTLISENSDTGMTATKSTLDTSGYYVKTAFNLTTSEGVYGGGHFDNDTTLNRNRNGHSIEMAVANRDKPIPYLISTKGWGLLWDNYSETYFSFLGATNRTLSVTSQVADQIDYYLVFGEQLDSIVAGYRKITGAAPMFPKYAYGFWHSREHYVSERQIDSMGKAFRTNSIPVDIIVQDWQWWAVQDSFNEGSWNNMTWDPDSFPTPTKMCDSLHNMNLHLALSVWPTVGEKSSVYSALHINGWLYPVKYYYGNGYVYDAFRPAAGDLLWSYMKPLMTSTSSVDVWWFDGSEPECGNSQGEVQDTLKRVLYSQGSNYLGTFYRYLTGFSLVNSGNVYRNQRLDVKSKRVCILTRSVYGGQQRYAAISWSGDCCVSWASFTEHSAWKQYRREIAWALNFCAAGIPYWTTDPGAYSNPYSTSAAAPIFRQNYTRWFQFVSFLPIFRSHGSAPSNREMFFFKTIDGTDSTYTGQLKFDMLRYRLLPYIYSLAWKVTSEGYTITRNLAFDFKSDANVYNVSTQFMFGPAFLVNPVTDSVSGGKSATSRSMYLPSGTTWYNFWTGDTLSGGKTITATASITSIPLYVKAGSIVPMGPNLQYANQKQADTIELRVYQGADGKFTIYEDEGDNYNYESGSYSTIPITYSDASSTLTIGARSGSFTGMLSSRVFNIVFVGSGKGTGVDITSSSNITKSVTYTGSAVSCDASGNVSVAKTAVKSELAIFNFSFKTAKKLITFGNEYSGKTKTVAVYDLKGKLIFKKNTIANTLDLRKDAHAAEGIYLVKVNVIK